MIIFLLIAAFFVIGSFIVYLKRADEFDTFEIEGCWTEFEDYYYISNEDVIILTRLYESIREVVCVDIESYQKIY